MRAMQKILFFVCAGWLSLQLAAAQTTCGLPTQTTAGADLFAAVHAELAAAPLTTKTVSGFSADAKTGAGKWQATFADPARPSSCYGLFAVQDYGTEADSLCRINAEISSPTPRPGYDLQFVAGSPYASAGYVLTEKSGAFKNVVSYLGRYQIGTLVYCGANQLDDFHARAVQLAQQFLAVKLPTDAATSSYAEAINYLARQGLASGYPDGTFRPSEPINRAEFTKIVAGAAGVGNAAATACFADVAADAWFTPFVCAARVAGIVAGYADGTFRPEKPVAVAEALKMTTAALTPKNVRTAAAGEAWYAPYVDAAKVAGVYLQSFATLDQKLTRGEMAELIYRLRTGTRSASALAFLVTAPAVDGGTFTATTLPIKITGVAPAGSSITVNGSYTLKSCCTTGGTAWEYNLTTSYGNVSPGDNDYEFVAKDSAGRELGRSKLRVIYQPAAN